VKVAATKIGLVPGDRDFHSFRRFFITTVRENGGDRDLLERVTHNSKGVVLDTYTRFGFEALCRPVLALPAPVVPAEGSAHESQKIAEGKPVIKPEATDRPEKKRARVYEFGTAIMEMTRAA